MCKLNRKLSLARASRPGGKIPWAATVHSQGTLYAIDKVIKNQKMRFIFSFIITVSLIVSTKAQIQNGNFELWEIYNNWERPVNWECASVSSETGSCDKITGQNGSLAVRIRNVMPCWEANSEDDFRTKGYVRSHFISPYDDFALSYQLRVDSIEPPSELILTLKGRIPGGGTDSLFEWRYDNLIDTTIEHLVFSTIEYDSIFIEFLAKGLFNENATSSCKKGYISAIIDDLRLDEIVSTEFLEPDDFRIYPNPVFSDLNILSRNEMLKEIHLYSIMGEKVLVVQEVNSIKYNLDLDHLHSGVYIVSFVMGQNRILRKIIKN